MHALLKIFLYKNLLAIVLVTASLLLIPMMAFANHTLPSFTVGGLDNSSPIGPGADIILGDRFAPETEIGAFDDTGKVAPSGMVAPNAAQSQNPFCSSSEIESVKDIFDFIGCAILRIFVPLVFISAFLVFLYGLLRYLRYNNSEIERAEARSYMIWGIITLFVIISIWGILRLVSEIGGLNEFVIPQFKQ